MFKITLRRLTALNSLVFLLIFLIFNSVVFGYLSFRLYDKIDDSMRFQARAFRIANGRIAPGGRPPFDPRIFILLKSDDGRLFNPNPFRPVDELRNITEVAANVKADEPEIQEYESHVYRMISVPYLYEDKTLSSDSTFHIQSVIAVSIVDSEVELLHNLLLITIGGGIFGMVGIFLAGHFLAKRAMVPIQASWEKQQQFVSDASHELRSPITGIYSNAELMLRHPERTIEQESFRINTIMNESMRMTKLISSLLTLARADANKAELQLAPVDVSEVIEVVLERFEPLEELNGVRIISDVKPNLQLIADKDRLHQLLVILLDNAFKYTPAGGTVEISCGQSEKSIHLSVRDTGQGIAPDQLPHIFDRFYRGDKARSRESGGTGLGLAIAKWIVETHGGKIRVDSVVGKGTTFMVTLQKRIKNSQSIMTP